MIFLLDVDIDYGSMPQPYTELLEREFARTHQLYEQGGMLRIWRKATGTGVVTVWDCPSHDALRERLASMPMSPFFSRVTATPLVAHPRYPQFASFDAPTGPALEPTP